MLLWMSSCGTGHSGGVPQDREDFASDIALETTYDLGLAHALPGAAVHVVHGSEVMTEPDQNDAIESRISLPVATRFSRCRLVLPEEAGTGLTPHSEAKAASECSRSGLLPAATRMAAAVPVICRSADQAEAAIRVSRSSSDRRSRILPVELKVAACEGSQGVLGRRCGIL